MMFLFAYVSCEERGESVKRDERDQHECNECGKTVLVNHRTGAVLTTK